MNFGTTSLRLRSFIRAQLRKLSFLAGFTIIAALVAIALLAPLLAPYDPWKRVGLPLSPPSRKHLLGTNDVGQDILSELLWASRVSLLIGFLSATLSAFIGMLLGAVSGYWGGIIDRVVTTITDILLLIPPLPLMIVLATFMGRGIFTIVFVIVLTSWPPVCRMIRAQVMSVKSLPFVEAAKALGANDSRILLKYVIPHVLPTTMAVSILGTGEAMIAEAALSFLGLGDPLMKSWGSMIYWAFVSGGFTVGAWWWFVPPGLFIAMAVFGFACLGYALEEELNPRLKG